MPLKALVTTPLTAATTLGINKDANIQDTNLQIVIIG